MGLLMVSGAFLVTSIKKDVKVDQSQKIKDFLNEILRHRCKTEAI